MDTKKMHALARLMAKYGLVIEPEYAFNQMTNFLNSSVRKKKGCQIGIIDFSEMIPDTLENVELFLLKINPKWDAKKLVKHKSKFIWFNYEHTLDSEGMGQRYTVIEFDYLEIMKAYDKL